jgi:hypothetical protein
METRIVSRFGINLSRAVIHVLRSAIGSRHDE